MHLRLLTVALVSLSACCSRAAEPTAAPLLPLLARFTAPGVPALGPAEVAATRNWDAPTTPAPARPGRGLAQHPMLYGGEGHNTLFLVNEGKVIWTYGSGQGGEIDDVWLLSNGHILYTRQTFVEEVTPEKKVVWHYDAPPGTEIHTAQPIGLDKVLFIQNGLPPKLIILNKTTGTIETSRDLPAQSFNDQKTVHPQFRRIRMTAAGTSLLSFLKMGQVVELDRDFKDIWRYEIPTPWAAIRLHNGNTLIVDERDRLVREVSPEKKTVWEFTQADLPPDVTFRNIQTAERLANGNTVIFSSTGGAKREDKPNLIQCVEVTPDKKVVWVLQDWKNLGPATTAQFLDQPGLSEKPGDVQR
jgi:outer membrane protein assembly factor BamB